METRLSDIEAKPSNIDSRLSVPKPTLDDSLPNLLRWFLWSMGIVGSLASISAVWLAILIYRRQGKEQTELTNKQTGQFKTLTDQQTEQFKTLTDQQTGQFEALARELSYEVHPIKPDEALNRVRQWFEDEDLVTFEFFSTFSIVPLFWNEEHRAAKATELLSERRYRDKIKLIGPSTKQSEKDFKAVATFLVNSKTEKRLKTSRVLNWLTDALVEMGELEWKESTTPSFENIEALLKKVKGSGGSAKLVESLSGIIAKNYRHEEEEIKRCVHYREQAAALTVNYALARFKNKSPSEAFEMLVFSDTEEDPSNLFAKARKPRPERMLSEPLIYRTRNRLLMRAICDPVKTILMKVNQEEVEHLTLWNIQHSVDEPSQGTVLILPNAYGILPYQELLANDLAEHGWDVYWLAFSGQGIPGELFLRSAVAELSIVISRLTNDMPKSLAIIAHGAGAWAILEYLKNEPAKCATLSTLVINGMLFNLKRVLESDINQMKERNVCAKLTAEEIEYNPIPALKVIDVPILFCHARDHRHLLRTNEEEMAIAVETAPRAKICWFDRGYDEDLEQLPPFVETYISWLSSAPENESAKA
ncbi:MAG TPA: hypothetical protein VF791_05055 [Pyrinomonadaceae bacterium]